MTNKLIITVLATLAALGAEAQPQATASTLRDEGQPAALKGESQYLLDDAMQLWQGSHNAAALSLDTMRTRGRATLSYSHRSGSLHRVQEGAQDNSLTFYTERYQQLGKWLYSYGSFNFSNGRTKQRAWSDVRRTYAANPFISGSAVAGSYDFQDIDLTARMGTAAIGKWRAGVAIDYRMGDLSRLRDPRSRSRMLEYRLTPSLTYTVGRHTVGLAGWYRRYKEKIPNINTVQDNPDMRYYQMQGVEAAQGTVGGYKAFSREYVNHELGAELSYGWQAARWQGITAVSLARGSESVLEQYKREPGHYYDYLYQLRSTQRLVTRRIIHQTVIEMGFRQAYADEYRPSLTISIDSLHGYTSQRYDNLLTYAKRYQLKGFDMGLRYRANFIGALGVDRYAGVSAKVSSLRQKHLLPTSSFAWTTTAINAEYGQALMANRRLWITVDGSLCHANKARLELSTAAGDYAQSVLVKDMDYYRADSWSVGIGLMYQFPLALKGYRALWYVKADGCTIRATHGLHTEQVRLTVGLFN